eukprot:TRINITY_DN2008_c0_g1_i54.p1 TRINITY_DN2008_c0_g1~~TRINITY_DN2008_c0_g1_i54.p1  ORF type:complete len:118 (+),score=16.18 TRINITY_DN2008_c0_g1_i54:104-457(+)
MYSNPLLSGTIPDSLGSLTQLVYLLMHSNPLWHRTRQPRKPRSACASQLPVWTCSFTANMYSNPFPSLSAQQPLLSGTIPDSLGSLSQLQWLPMHSNPLLSGTIPDSLGSLDQLVDL